MILWWILNRIMIFKWIFNLKKNLKDYYHIKNSLQNHYQKYIEWFHDYSEKLVLLYISLLWFYVLPELCCHDCSDHLPGILNLLVQNKLAEMLLVVHCRARIGNHSTAQVIRMQPTFRHLLPLSAVHFLLSQALRRILLLWFHWQEKQGNIKTITNISSY